MRGRRYGFTLVEIIIVVVVLGVMAGLAIPKLSGMLDSGALDEARMNMEAVLSSEEVYRINTGGYLAANSNTALNTGLQTNLATHADRTWDYETTVSLVPLQVCVTATRVRVGVAGCPRWRQCSGGTAVEVKCP